MGQETESETRRGRQGRREALARLEERLDGPMLALGFAWLALLIVEFTWGLTPLLERLLTLIWLLFVAEFLFRLALAPNRVDYLKENLLIALSLLLPALRLFRFARLLRLARAGRGLRLVRLLGSIDRSMRMLGATMERRGFGYVVVLTILVTVVGAAGIYTFEREVAGPGGLPDYGAALWWTAMLMTTLGSEYWPQTAEGRLLTFFLALYAFAVFGYVTATLATYFIGQEAASEESEVAGSSSVEALRAEIAALRAELRALSKQERDAG